MVGFVKMGRKRCQSIKNDGRDYIGINSIYQVSLVLDLLKVVAKKKTCPNGGEQW